MAGTAQTLRERLSSLFSRILERLSPNRSSRGGANVLGAVIHTTESADGTLDGVVRYLSDRGVEVSSHYVVEATAAKGEQWTRVVRLVPEDEKAWTAKSANPYFVQYELIGRAARTREQWLTMYRTQLETVAALVAEDVLQYGFPVERNVPGIVGHGDLAGFGYPNDHTDPGPGFPWPEFLRMVRHYVEYAAAPDVRKELARLRGRPLEAPYPIPRWAWQLDKWWSTRPALRGPKPILPAKFGGRVPAWFWQWRKWLHGVRDHSA